MKIAIFGATSIIAKEHIKILSQNYDHQLTLYSRKVDQVDSWIKSNLRPRTAISCPYSEFNTAKSYDAIINFIGCGDSQRLSSMISEFEAINDFYDIKILDYVSHNPHTKYVYLSSGAVHNSGFDAPILNSNLSKSSIAGPGTTNQYVIAKQKSEIRHRALDSLNIIDLRVFNYLPRKNINNDNSLVGDIFNCLVNKKTFITSSTEIRRDFIDDDMFANAVSAVLSVKNLNSPFDLYSKNFIAKKRLLRVLNKKFGLKFEIQKEKPLNWGITGLKPHYYSLARELREHNYEPHGSSEEILIKRAHELLE